jgi:hypothetical protein
MRNRTTNGAAPWPLSQISTNAAALTRVGARSQSATSRAALAVPLWWLVVIFLSLIRLGRSLLKPNERKVLVLR